MAKKGKKLSKEHRKKISDARKGIKFSEEHRKKLSKAKKGKSPWNKDKTGIYSEETKKKMSSAKKGKPVSDSQKLHLQKLAQARKGKKHSEESKNKMSGRVISEETRKRMSGRINSEETKQKMGSGRRGKEAGKETLEKMSVARSKQVFPRNDTKGEIILQDICKKNGIEFIKHKNFNLGFQRHQIDLFIEPNICIESDGDYWHANPNNYKRNGRTQTGYKPNKIISKSKQKITRAKDRWELDERITDELIKQGNVVLRFWESEIENNPEKCLQKIIKAIKESKQ